MSMLFLLLRLFLVVLGVRWTMSAVQDFRRRTTLWRNGRRAPARVVGWRQVGPEDYRLRLSLPAPGGEQLSVELEEGWAWPSWKPGAMLPVIYQAGEVERASLARPVMFWLRSFSMLLVGPGLLWLAAMAEFA